MRKSFLLLAIILWTSLLVGCGGTTTQTCPETAQNEALAEKPAAETAQQAEPASDAVSGASKPYYDKPDFWNKEKLIAALRDHQSWNEGVFWAMATVDKNGKPNISAIVPFALNDDILIFANKNSLTRANLESTGICHAIFRSLDPKSADPKKFDFFGVVGSRVTLEFVNNAEERDALWKEYKAQKTPVSPPHFTVDDHFFMKIIKVEPIG